MQAQAQFGDVLGRTIDRAVKGEVQRKVDTETRHAVRCAMGDEACARAAAAGAQTGGAAAQGTGVAQSAAGGASASVDPGGDHPLVQPYQGSVRDQRQYQAYSDYRQIVGYKNRQPVTQTIEGTVTRIKYNNPRGRSTFEIMRNYESALQAKGYRVTWQCVTRDVCGTTHGWPGINGLNLGIGGDVRYMTGTLRKEGGGEAVISIGVTPSITYIHVVETSAMDTGQVTVNADQLAAGLARDGKVTLQGIYFDTGKDTLKTESDPALMQVGLLMRDQPNLRLRVVGHTDDQGGAALNQTLSQHRAERVRQAIISRYGVDSARLTAVGMGSRQPVASNATEEGRAQNRRVELVRE